MEDIHRSTYLNRNYALSTMVAIHGHRLCMSLVGPKRRVLVYSQPFRQVCRYVEPLLVEWNIIARLGYRCCAVLLDQRKPIAQCRRCSP